MAEFSKNCPLGWPVQSISRNICVFVCPSVGMSVPPYNFLTMLTGDFEYLGRAPRSAVASPGSPPHCCYCSPLHCLRGEYCDPCPGSPLVCVDLGRGSPGQPSVAVGPGTGGVSRPESPSGRRGPGQSCWAHMSSQGINRVSPCKIW